MKLELALVISSNKAGCLVSVLRNNLPIEAKYSLLVQDRIMIRPKQLVAIDRESSPPIIVWRWLRGAVLELNDDVVVVDDMQGHAAKVSRIPALPLTLKLDDEVWVCGVGESFEIHDLLVDEKPRQPNRILRYITPIIEEIYKKR